MNKNSTIDNHSVGVMFSVARYVLSDQQRLKRRMVIQTTTQAYMQALSVIASGPNIDKYWYITTVLAHCLTRRVTQEYTLPIQINI